MPTIQPTREDLIDIYLYHAELNDILCPLCFDYPIGTVDRSTVGRATMDIPVCDSCSNHGEIVSVKVRTMAYLTEFAS